MIDLLRRKEEEYIRKADMFLLPLTGLKKDNNYDIKAYLFWRDYSIHDYKLILCFSYENLEEFTEYCRKNIFPVLDKKGYILENYDVEGRSIFILDMSEWAMDIQMFILGKYSKLSREAKEKIKEYHKSPKGSIAASIYGIINPTMVIESLDNKSFMEYIALYYDLDLEELKKMGETGSIYDRMSETLITDVEELCKTGIETW